jgi:hypothetical protein
VYVVAGTDRQEWKGAVGLDFFFVDDGRWRGVERRDRTKHVRVYCFGMLLLCVDTSFLHPGGIRPKDPGQIYLENLYTGGILSFPWDGISDSIEASHAPAKPSGLTGIALKGPGRTNFEYTRLPSSVKLIARLLADVLVCLAGSSR